jgi:hypothetical protein
MNAHCFTLHVENPAEEVTYQAPDRTSTRTSNWFMTLAIGSCLYIKVSPTLWAKPSCTGHFGNVLAGRSLALGYLHVLSEFSHFQHHGATYASTVRIHTIPSVMAPVFGVSSTEQGGIANVQILNIGPGGVSFTMKTTVVVQDGYVATEKLSITGPDSYSGSQVLTYSGYGSSPALTAPPSN